MMNKLDFGERIAREITKKLRDYIALWLNKKDGDIEIEIMKADFSSKDLRKLERIAEKHGLRFSLYIREHKLSKPLFGRTSYLMIRCFFEI
jgi:hypothetical protein